jgi:hypothetical protein
VVNERARRAGTEATRTNVRKRSSPGKRAWVPNPTGINQHRYAIRPGKKITGWASSSYSLGALAAN